MLVEQKKIKVVDQFSLDAIKTKAASAALKRLDMSRAVVVDGRIDGDGNYRNNEELRLSVRNLEKFKYLRPDGVNVYDLLRFDGLIVTREGLKGLETRLAK